MWLYVNDSKHVYQSIWPYYFKNHSFIHSLSQSFSQCTFKESRSNQIVTEEKKCLYKMKEEKFEELNQFDTNGKNSLVFPNHMGTIFGLTKYRLNKIGWRALEGSGQMLLLEIIYQIKHGLSSINNYQIKINFTPNKYCTNKVTKQDTTGIE